MRVGIVVGMGVTLGGTAVSVWVGVAVAVAGSSVAVWVGTAVWDAVAEAVSDAVAVGGSGIGIILIGVSKTAVVVRRKLALSSSDSAAIVGSRGANSKSLLSP